MGYPVCGQSRWRRVLSALGVVLAGLALALPFRSGRPARGGMPSDHPNVVDVPLRGAECLPAVGPPVSESPATAALDGHWPARSTEPTARPDLATAGPLPALPHAFGPDGAASRDELVRAWKPVRLSVPGPQPTLRRHRLTDGDTLERLAARYLGSASRAEEIYAINRDLLAAPDLLPLGRIIRIPAAEQ